MGCKAVILAAGNGTRLSPITPFVPKEMMPISGFPAIHHVVYEMAELGVQEVMIVLSRSKDAIRRYFTESVSPKGVEACELSLRRSRLLSRISVTFAYQNKMRGTGDAILLAKEFAGEDDLFVAYPDDLILLDGMSAGRNVYDLFVKKNSCSAILTREVPGKDASRFGVVMPCEMIAKDSRCVFVESIVEKPAVFGGERACVMIGRMRLTRACLEEIDRHPLRDSDGIIPALNAVARQRRLIAVCCPFPVHDIGSHEGYASAFINTYVSSREPIKYE